jgi:glycosyltransferase involved in cell wall biosynthesis
MKVTLVAHYLDESTGHGIDRYCLKLMQGLREKGIIVNPISSPPVFLGSLKSALDFFLYLPLRSLCPFGTGDLFHFVAPQAGLAIPVLKKLYGKKVVTTIYDTGFYHVRNQTRYLLIGKSYAAAIRHSDVLLAISSQTKADLIEYFKVDGNKVRVTPLAADKKFRPLDGKRDNVFTIGYLGGFAYNKNVPFLIRAYSLFEKRCSAPCRLVLYGKGADYQDCIQLAKELGTKNIEFRGFADEKDVVDIYNSFHVFVFPSIDEGFGLPMMEAQMCHVPTIVKEGAHVPEEATRFCLKAKDEKHLAELLEKIRSEGFVFSKEHLEYLRQFTWDACIDKTISAYEDVLRS